VICENTMIGLVMTKMLFDISGCTIDVLQDELFTEKQVSVSVLRLDKIHATVSGNKLFKLHYFLTQALEAGHKPILTFGGAYSNHLVATAFACKALQLPCIGVVRGERPAALSGTLQQCMGYGMQLKFISRQAYSQKDDVAFITQLEHEYGNCIIVPEGGFSPFGAAGAALITQLFDNNIYTHVCTATGTATTLAGLLQGLPAEKKVIGVNVLKGESDTEERVAWLTNKAVPHNLQLQEGYHFGGYAKQTPALIDFMNGCWVKYALPLDFVYTAKMLYAVIDNIKKDNFEKGSHILCLHTGGLQGNNSLPFSSLLY